MSLIMLYDVRRSEVVVRKKRTTRETGQEVVIFKISIRKLNKKVEKVC